MDVENNPEWIIEVRSHADGVEQWSPLPGDRRTLAACRAGVEERTKLAGSLTFRLRNVVTEQIVSWPPDIV